MARRFSALVSTTWICISVVLLLLPKIYCEEQTPCGEVILLDSDRPTAEITSTDKQYRHGGTDDDATKECLWYFRSPPGTTIRLDIVTLDPMANPLTVYDGPGVEKDDGKGIELGGSQENSFISSGRGLTCKLPTQSNDINQEYTVTVQASLLQGEISIEAANPGECGETIYLNENSPTSLFNITNSYPSGGSAYCYWYIYSPSNTYTIVEFINWQSLDYNDYLYIYDSRGRVIFRATGDFYQAPNPVVSDSYVRLKLDAYYSVSDTYFGVKISYTDELRHNTDGVFQSSGGVIELNENTTSLTVRSTNFASSYIPYMDNYWFVTGPVGRRLKVEFHQLNSGDFSVCDSSSTSRIVSRFSRPSVMPEDRVSTENAVTLYFYLSYGTYQGVGVLFTISITDEYPVVGQQTCGGTIELDSSHESFVFNSPYYYSQQLPSGYTDCYWYVTSPAGKQVQLVWLDIETSSEYVRVYDYPSSTSYQVSWFEGNVDADLSPFVSTRGGITIYLDDYSSGTNGRGFLANVSLSDGTSVVGPRSCGGTVRLSNSMPNFILNSPYYYQPSSQAYVRCYWHVQSSLGQEVELTWLDIDTSEYIYLYDHPYSGGYTVSSIHGTIDVDISPVVSSRGGWTVYHYDYYSGNNGRGFLAEFSLRDTPYYASSDSCGGSIQLTQSSPNVTFSTPYYYQLSTSNVYMDCFWYITSPSGKQVELTVLDLETRNERVYINDHTTSTSSSYRVSYLDGRLESPATVLSSRGGVTVHYGDYSSAYNGPGLLFEAKILDSKPDYQPGFCGGTVALTDSSPDFTFTTPLYNDPSTSAVTTDCWMYITCPSGKQVQLTIRDFNTANEEIVVYDHPSSYSSSYIVSFLSGLSASQAVVISSRGGLTLFYDDYNSGYNGPGAFIEAHIVDAVPSSISGFCGGVIPLSTSTPTVTTTTPLFYQPSSSNVKIDCWWYVTSPSGKQVEMSIHDLQTENEQVYVYDYPSSSSYQVSRLRGNVSDSTVVSTRGGFSVVFDDTSSSGNGPGFAMDVALTDEFTWDDEGIDSCGQTVYLDSSSPSIVFRTPTYPIEVLNDQYYCYWYLTCPYGHRISLLFHDFDTYSSSRFTVYDYSSASSTYQLAEISSRSLPGTAAIQSSSNRLTVYYYDADWSDVTKQRGVLADAVIVPEEEPVWDRVEPMSSCGSAITLTGRENRITLTTPDYPDVNGDYYECTWFVQCPSQTAVRIDFNDFWVDSSGYLRVYDGPTTGYSVMLYATGSSLPSSVVSSSNTMTTYYYNNRGTSGKGASFVMSCVFEANVDCDSTSMTVFLDRRLLSNGTNAEDVHFQDDDCVGIDHDTTQIVLYTRYDRCSTILEETETSIIYSNVVTYYTPRPIPGTEITRESILKMNVQCELDRHRLLGDSFVPKTGEISFNETGYGDFSLRLDRYTDATFDEFADDDDEDIILGEHLYFAVNLTSVAGLTVFIENCWATPSQYPNDAKSYTFLDNGCSEDPTMHMIYFADPSFAPFVIDAFTFIEENPQVFIHCEVLVCNDNDPSSRCAQGCQTRFRRGSRYTRGTSSTPHLISNGPLSTFHTMHVAGAQNSDGSPVGLESGLLIGVLACVTCLIVALVAILLYMMPSRRTSQHLYHRVNVNDDDE